MIECGTPIGFRFLHRRAQGAVAQVVIAWNAILPTFTVGPSLILNVIATRPAESS